MALRAFQWLVLPYFFNVHHHYQIFPDMMPKLVEYSEDPKHDNPKLEQLKGQIMKYQNMQQGDVAMRCMVFCQTRQICSCLVDWAKETEGLVDLNATFLTGSSATSDKKGTKCTSGLSSEIKLFSSCICMGLLIQFAF
jgi:ERCC4-related helicase